MSLGLKTALGFLPGLGTPESILRERRVILLLLVWLPLS